MCFFTMTSSGNTLRYVIWYCTSRGRFNYKDTKDIAISVSSESPFNIHRSAEAGKDLWGSASPTLQLKAGQLEQVSQNHVVGFWIFQGWRLHNPQISPSLSFSELNKPSFLSFLYERCSNPSSAPLHLCWEVINTPETSWTACAFQCCPSSRYQRGLSPPWGAGQSSILSCCSLTSRMTSPPPLPSPPFLDSLSPPTAVLALCELSHWVFVIQVRSTSATAHRYQLLSCVPNYQRCYCVRSPYFPYKGR